MGMIGGALVFVIHSTSPRYDGYCDNAGFEQEIMLLIILKHRILENCSMEFSITSTVH
jgi:hypothetical protein